MEKQTATDWLFMTLALTAMTDWYNVLEKAKAMEKEQIKNAVIYGLDEDGHTGDWKISVAQNYYNKTFTNENTGTKAD